MKSKPETAKPVHPYDWLVEPLHADHAYVERSMFGCRASYMGARLVLVAARSGSEPWNGLLVPTDHVHHQSICAQINGLAPHPVLGKWLYLAESSDCFENSARRLVDLVRRADPRIGVDPKPRKRSAGRVDARPGRKAPKR